jgi:hypothetical protein
MALFSLQENVLFGSYVSLILWLAVKQGIRSLAATSNNAPPLPTTSVRENELSTGHNPQICKIERPKAEDCWIPPGYLGTSSE